MSSFKMSNENHRELKRRRMSEVVPKVKAMAYDMLPICALENIVRFLSEKPQAEQWQNFVDVKVALSILRLGGSLARIARDLITSIDLTGNAIPPAQRGVLVEGVDSPFVRSAFMNMGGHLKRLHIVSARVDQWYIATLTAHCRNLRHLSVRSEYTNDGIAVENLLASCGASLYVLEFRVGRMNMMHLKAISDHCRRLRRFDLVLKSLAVSLARLWRKIGGTIESLYLKHGELSAPALSRWALHTVGICCGRLTRLGFFASNSAPSYAAAMEKLCTTFGPRLRQLALYIPKMGPQALRRIVAACPNTEIAFGPCFSDTAIDSVVAAGRSAISATINMRGIGIGMLETVASACPNLKKCKAYGQSVTETMVSRFFANPRPELIDLDIEWVDSGTSSDIVLRVLAEKAQFLNKFRFGGWLPPPERWRGFAAANRNLKSVTIVSADFCSCVFRNSRNVDWPPVVAAFLSCPHLVELECTCLIPSKLRVEHIARVCLRAKSRGIAVSVCGTTY